MNKPLLSTWRRAWDVRGVDAARPLPWLVALRVWAAAALMFGAPGWLFDVAAGVSVGAPLMLVAGGIVAVGRLGGLAIRQPRRRARIGVAAAVIVMVALPPLLWVWGAFA